MYCYTEWSPANNAREASYLGAETGLAKMLAILWDSKHSSFATSCRRPLLILSSLHHAQPKRPLGCMLPSRPNSQSRRPNRSNPTGTRPHAGPGSEESLVSCRADHDCFLIRHIQRYECAVQGLLLVSSASSITSDEIAYLYEWTRSASQVRQRSSWSSSAQPRGLTWLF